MTTASVSDGRSARSRRTRDTVVDALLALNRGGNLRPTAREIAAEAGVSLRSVYVHFDDLEDLYLAAAKRHVELVSGMLVEVPATGSLRSRVETLVRERARIYEAVGNVGKAASLQEPFSPTIARWLAASRKASAREVERVFAKELDDLAPDARARTLAMACALAGPAVWDVTRRAPHQLDAAATRTAVADAIVAVFEHRE
jgi:AcrR family transcriptional regulator